MRTAIDILLWFAALSAGVMAGVYFAFSVFVMRALAELELPGGMLAMRSVNRVIMRSAFLPLFLVSSVACLVLLAIALLRAGEPGAWPMAAGGAVYLVGMLLVTMRGNVPLNNALEAADPATPEGAAVWDRFLRPWTVWNHIRTAACLVSLALFIAAIAMRS